jgi:hypothetical protein
VSFKCFLLLPPARHHLSSYRARGLRAGKRKIKARGLGLRRIINVHETCSTSLFSLIPTHWALGDPQQSHKTKKSKQFFSKAHD